MQVKTVPVLIDDEGNECRVGDDIIVTTPYIDYPSKATIVGLGLSVITLKFEDRMIGGDDMDFRFDQIRSCKKMQRRGRF